MTASRVRARKHKVFRSVFQTDHSQPTPKLPSTQQGEAFGGPLASLANKSHQHTVPPLQPPSDQVRWDRAWHVVTSHIQLPSSVAIEDSFGTNLPQSQDLDPEFEESLSVVLQPDNVVPRATDTEDILGWHIHQVRQHFNNHVLPLLAACASQGDQSQVLLSSIQTLEAAHRQYLFGLSLILRGFSDGLANAGVEKFRRDLHAVIGNSWTPGLMKALRDVFHGLLTDILGPGKQPGGHDGDRTARRRVTRARDELLSLLESLQQVGLAGDKFQILFAELMDQTMSEYIQKTYAGVWAKLEASTERGDTATLGCAHHLSDWVENHYGRLAVEVFGRLGGNIAWGDVQRWRDVAIGRLAALRIQELFDIVLSWPRSKGGLEDLRSAVTTPQRRLQLTDTFSAMMQKRLLHPGCSTLVILRTYISMIRTFHALDQSTVLLDRVAHALQLYLCHRDDAIRIVVTGLLSNPRTTNAEDSKGKLVELAVILNEAFQQQRRHAEEEDLDWGDMTWVPDPSDAGFNYKRPKNQDVIGTLINALGSQDIFIKEFQLIISERLLSSQPNFQQESKVLGLLKKRFGESALQNCDVMMKDIQDSKTVDDVIRKEQNLSPPAESDELSFHSRILSRLFWPSLPKNPFVVPATVAKTQGLYEEGFGALKTRRRLNWLDHLGSATVKLDLEDRSLEVKCKTYEAAVIHQFHDNGSGRSDPQQRTFNELWETLMMDEDLLEAALKFWTSKRVLRDIGDQTFVVLEKLDDEETAGEAAEDSLGAGPSDGPPSPRKAKNLDAKEQAQRTVYWQFIVGMLTNSSPAMPLGQISMMMKMLIADGCPWSNEELQEFLGEKIAEGVLELAGGKYKLPKKG
ncbi:putative anaphase-promoting complex subunit ApcB [Stachybotrys elegans]|uniref:Anaphase-promoting complex subunit 2 n=1 Tax=Stachybotrys elegans TaxID=80388 RepID=A0A8K0WWI4_9HYPO|nr:putative anaphase-promoting complex subunit ApcB [Stachybotrys elegans]